MSLPRGAEGCWRLPRQGLLALWSACAVVVAAPAPAPVSEYAPLSAAASGPAQAAPSGWEADAAWPARPAPEPRPQDNLYLWANGAWRAATPLPPDQGEIGSFADVSNRVNTRLLALLQGAQARLAADGLVEEPLLRDLALFFQASLDTATQDAAGLTPVAPWLAEIDALRTPADLARLWGRWQGSVALPLQMDAWVDMRQPSRHALKLEPDGLGLSREEHLGADAESRRLQRAYRQHVAHLLHLAGDAQADAHTAQVVALERRLAQAQWPAAQAQNLARTWHPRHLADWQRQAPGLDWAAWLAQARLGTQHLVLAQPSHGQALARLVATTPLAHWQHYLRVRLLDAAAPLLSAPWRQAHEAFHRQALLGRHDPPPAQRALELLSQVMPTQLGQAYAERHAPPALRQQATELLERLRLAYRQALEAPGRLHPSTRAQALLNLATLRLGVAEPARRLPLPPVTLHLTDPAGNLLRAGRQNHQQRMARLAEPVDGGLWPGTYAHAVNAYYEPGLHQVIVPAGILAPPLFDPEADDTQRYAALGSVLAHEMGHALDAPHTVPRDAQGPPHTRWHPADRRAHAQRGLRLVQQYQQHCVVLGQHVDGRLTLLENQADVAGLALVWRAWQAAWRQRHGTEPPAAQAQRFFHHHALAWRSKTRPEQVLAWLRSDLHAPDECRVNGPARNLDAFHQAFGTRPGDGMYLPPAQRVRIW